MITITNSKHAQYPKNEKKKTQTTGISVRDDERDALSNLEVHCADLLHLTSADLSELHAGSMNEDSITGIQSTPGGRTYTHVYNDVAGNRDKNSIMQSRGRTQKQEAYSRALDEGGGDLAVARKICVLIWAYVCRLCVEGSMGAEMRGVAQNAVRVLRALFEVCLYIYIHKYVCMYF